MIGRLVQFDSGYFCAAIEVRGDLVFKAAPILKYMVGWTLSRAIAYARSKKWKITFIGDRDEALERVPISGWCCSEG